MTKTRKFIVAALVAVVAFCLLLLSLKAAPQTAIAEAEEIYVTLGEVTKGSGNLANARGQFYIDGTCDNGKTIQQNFGSWSHYLNGDILTDYGYREGRNALKGAEGYLYVLVDGLETDSSKKPNAILYKKGTKFTAEGHSTLVVAEDARYVYEEGAWIRDYGLASLSLCTLAGRVNNSAQFYITNTYDSGTANKSIFVLNGSSIDSSTQGLSGTVLVNDTEYALEDLQMSGVYAFSIDVAANGFKAWRDRMPGLTDCTKIEFKAGTVVTSSVCAGLFTVKEDICFLYNSTAGKWEEHTHEASGTPEYTWTKTENGYSVRAAVACACGTKIEEEVKATSEITKEATCLEKGEMTYTAAFTKSGFETQTRTEETEIGGHAFGEWIAEAPAKVGETGVKAHKTCSVCNKHFDIDGTELTDLTIAALTGVKYMSVSTAGDVGLNFYVYTGKTEGLSAKFTFRGSETAAEGVYDEATDCVKFTYAVAAKDYKETVAIAVDGTEITAEYSVEQYAKDLPASDKAYPLAEKLIAYCEAARAYFAQETVSPINVSTDGLETYKGTVEGSEEGIVLQGATLVLEDKIKINVYFRTESTEGLVCKVDGVEATPVAVAGHENLYVIGISGIVAKDLNKAHEIKIGGYTVTYSALSYAQAVISDGTAADLVNVVKALYVFGMEAENYFKETNDETV